MRVEQTEIPEVVQVWPHVHGDSRGYFFESFQSLRFAAAGMPSEWVQDNESRSAQGVIRGLHYQLAPHAQGKLVRAVVGRIFDVAVDIRPRSATFGQWVGRVLDDVEHAMLYVPRGFAHGFSVLSEVAIVAYKCDALWHAGAERGIAYNDPLLRIDWHLDGLVPTLSEKDRVHPMLADAELES